jgi:hypothetical protein
MQHWFWTAVMLGAASLVQPSAAAGRKAAPKPPAETVRYVMISATLEDGREIDGYVREARVGNKPNSGTLDICHRVSASSEQWDRATIQLKPEGPALRGVGASQIGGVPVEVRLQRKGAGQSVTYEGTIRRGSDQMRLETDPGEELDEAAFKEEQEAAETAIVEQPEDFLEVSAESVAVRSPPRCAASGGRGVAGRTHRAQSVGPRGGLHCSADRRAYASHVRGSRRGSWADRTASPH